MKLLVTGCGRPLAERVADYFGEAHDVARAGEDLREPKEAASLVAGVEALVHVGAYDPAPLDGGDREPERLDMAARSAYVLLDEAARAGVPRAIVVSRLDLFDGYPADFVLDPTFRPVPDPDADALAPYLVEQTFREFAREGRIRSICLRFGAIDAAGGTSGADALGALERALAMPFEPTGYRWYVYHIATDNPRFPLRGERRPPLAFKAES